MTRRRSRPVLSLGLLALTTRLVFSLPEFAQQQYIGAAPTAGLHVPQWHPEISSEVENGGQTYADPAFCKLSTTSPYQLNEGFGSDPMSAYVPSVGVLRAYMIFVDFDDAPASERTTDLHGVFMPAASEWYGNASFGRLDLCVAADLSRFYRMPRNSSEYIYRRGMGYEEHLRYVQDALDAVGRSVNFTGTDLLYIVPTKEAAAISYSPTFMAPVRARDGTLIFKTVTFGQDAAEFGFKVMNHETGHTMGLPDLYSYEPHTAAGIYVGGYDLMAVIGGISPDLLVWHKWRLGWIDDDQVVCLSSGTTKSNSTKYTLTPVEAATGLTALVVRYNTTLAIVAENRSGRQLNNDTCGTGVLIYTVSTMTASGQGPIRVQDSSPKSEGCAGGKLNDALFVPGDRNRSSFVGFGVNITVVNEVGEGFIVEVSFDYILEADSGVDSLA